jgi:hypothetical protein
LYSRVSTAIDWIEEQICNLSAFPPDGCGGSGPSSSYVRVRVDITLDDYPEDISWKVTRESITGVIVVSGGNYIAENVLESKFVVSIN